MNNLGWDQNVDLCTLGWCIQAIWPEYVDGINILSADRSSNNRFTSTTDATGIIKVFRYPVLQKGADCITTSAHSSVCAKARFNADDKYLISIGGKDRTILQWRVLASNTGSCQ